MDKLLRTTNRAELQIITREQLLEAYMDWLNMQSKSELTRQTYKLRLGKFLDWVGDRWPVVTPVDVVAWRDALAESYKSPSVALHLTAARQFYAFLVEKGVISSNPFAGVRSPARKNSTTRKRDTLSKQEWRSLLATCDDTPVGKRDAAILLLAYELGLREIEITRANLEDIRTNGGLQKLWIHGKGDEGANAWLVVPPHVEQALSAWLKVRGKQPGPLFTSYSRRSLGDRLSLSTIRSIWKQHKDQAGIVGERKTFHSLRHTAIDSRARYAVKHGKSPYLVQTFARHKSLDTTMQYIHDIGREDDPPELWGTNTNGNGEQ